jgi:hypothetical protein
MKLKIAQITYCLYLKGSRYIGCFIDVETAVKHAETYYKGIETHMEPLLILGEER